MKYPKNTIRRAEKIVRYGLTGGDGERTYLVVDNVVYTDVFEDDITITGYNGSYKKAFNGDFNSTDYYNEIHLTSRCIPKQITVSADWGSKCLLKELEQLLDWLEDNTFEDSMDNAGAKSLKIEDFSITQGSAEEVQKAKYDSIMANFSFYIRNPIIVGVSPEWKDDYRHF